MPDEPRSEDNDRVLAAMEMLGRLGANSTEVRYSEPELGEDSPTVWIAIAQFKRYNAPPQVAAGLHLRRALEVLLEQLVDGGVCKHCKKNTAFFANHEEAFDLAGTLCVYTYDPEMKTYSRGCEGT